MSDTNNIMDLNRGIRERLKQLNKACEGLCSGEGQRIGTGASSFFIGYKGQEFQVRGYKGNSAWVQLSKMVIEDICQLTPHVDTLYDKMVEEHKAMVRKRKVVIETLDGLLAHVSELGAGFPTESSKSESSESNLVETDAVVQIANEVSS